MNEPEGHWWICSICRYMLHAAEHPDECPNCKNKCAFIDATCYTPECGGPANPDPKIVLDVARQPLQFVVNDP